MEKRGNAALQFSSYDPVLLQVFNINFIVTGAPKSRLDYQTAALWVGHCIRTTLTPEGRA
jgi:hypothetical protein